MHMRQRSSSTTELLSGNSCAIAAMLQHTEGDLVSSTESPDALRSGAGIE